MSGAAPLFRYTGFPGLEVSNEDSTYSVDAKNLFDKTFNDTFDDTFNIDDLYSDEPLEPEITYDTPEITYDTLNKENITSDHKQNKLVEIKTTKHDNVCPHFQGCKKRYAGPACECNHSLDAYNICYYFIRGTCGYSPCKNIHPEKNTKDNSWYFYVDENKVIYSTTELATTNNLKSITEIQFTISNKPYSEKKTYNPLNKDDKYKKEDFDTPRKTGMHSTPRKIDVSNNDGIQKYIPPAKRCILRSSSPLSSSPPSLLPPTAPVSPISPASPVVVQQLQSTKSCVDSNTISSSFQVSKNNTEIDKAINIINETFDKIADACMNANDSSSDNLLHTYKYLTDIIGKIEDRANTCYEKLKKYQSLRQDLKRTIEDNNTPRVSYNC